MIFIIIFKNLLLQKSEENYKNIIIFKNSEDVNIHRDITLLNLITCLFRKENNISN